jgi:glycosyltransferase involved in cell wall biosynthesis
MREALRRLTADHPSAVLHLDMPGVALAGLGLAPGRTVYSSHNVEHRIWREVARRRPLTHRPFLAVEWRKIAHEEQRCWRRADLTLAVSEPDAAAMRAAGARRVEVVPNGADPVEALPPRAPAADEPVRLLFVGSGAYWPYEHGLAWFTRQVMPLLRERHRVQFHVVGERPVVPVTGEGITYHGRVGDLRPFYEAADAVVVPVFEGSGTRLKVIEAAMYGRPVISTGLGAEGLPVRPGAHYLRAETPAEWVDAVQRLRAGGLSALVPAARGALEDLTWPRIGAALAELYLEL